MKYLTKRSCERAIERKIRKYKPSSFSLKPVKDGRFWKIDVIVPVVTRALVLGYELGLIRKIIERASYNYPGDGRDVEKVKKYFDEALHAAIVALGEIEAVFESGEVTECSAE